MSYGIVPRVGNTGLLDKAREFSAGAIGARSAMHPGSTTKTTPPGKTAGGAIGSTAGMAGAGAMIGAGALKGSVGGPWGAVIGAGVGLAAYFLS
jgi:hypothetical protein